MSIANYGELKTAVANWMARGDLTDRIPEFIASGLQRVNNELLLRNGLPDQEQVSTTPTVADQASLALPSDFGALRWIKIDYSTTAETVPLLPMGYDAIVERYGETTGTPEVYALQDGSCYLGPTPDGVYTVRIGYIKRYAALSNNADTNYLFTAGNNVLLWAALMEACVYTQDDARAQQTFVPAYRASMDGLRLAARRARQARPPMQMVDDAVLSLSGNGRTGSITRGY